MHKLRCHRPLHLPEWLNITIGDQRGGVLLLLGLLALSISLLLSSNRAANIGGAVGSSVLLLLLYTWFFRRWAAFELPPHTLILGYRDDAPVIVRTTAAVQAGALSGLTRLRLICTWPWCEVLTDFRVPDQHSPLPLCVSAFVSLTFTGDPDHVPDLEGWLRVSERRVRRLVEQELSARLTSSGDPALEQYPGFGSTLTEAINSSPEMIEMRAAVKLTVADIDRPLEQSPPRSS